MDVYSEVTIPRRLARDPAKTKYRLWITCLVMTFLGVMLSFYLLIPAVILWIVYLFAKRLLEFDFEYIQTNDILDIDMVMGGFSRRNMMTFSLSQVLIVAPWDADELEEFEHIKPVDYSARDPRNRPYVVVCVVREQRKKLYLQLDDKMLHSLKQVIPQKVIIKK